MQRDNGTVLADVPFYVGADPAVISRLLAVYGLTTSSPAAERQAAAVDLVTRLVRYMRLLVRDDAIAKAAKAARDAEIAAVDAELPEIPEGS